jgi:tetratricopeptide (TPR) repeat protein
MFPSPRNAQNPRHRASDSLGKPASLAHCPLILKRALVLLTFLSGSLCAQIPRAQPVDGALNADAGNDFFQRGKNLYDAAQAASNNDSREDYFQRSAEIFSEYLNNFSDHPNAEMAWWYLGNSYYQAGQVEDGKRCFNTLLNRYSKGKWGAAAAYTLAADHYNQGEYASAAPLFESFANHAVKPEERPRGNYLAGNCYRLLGRDREAMGAFTRVVEDPAGGLFAPQAKVALGHLFLKAGKLPEALGRFEEVISGISTDKIRGEAALHGSLTATKLGKTELADKYLQLILNTPGMSAYRVEAQTALMGNLFAKNQYGEVLEVFRRSSTKADGETEASRLMFAARSYLRLKQPSEAIELFRDIEKLVKPENDLAFYAAYYRLLCFFQIEGRHIPAQVDAFLQLYRKSRSEDPRIHTAMMMKAETLFAAKQNAAAAKVYNEINATLVSDKNRRGLLYQRGWCLSEAGDAQGAVRSLSEFISKYPEDSRVASAIAKRAKAFVESAEPGKAITDFDYLTATAAVPPELKSFAWLESARLRRSENNLPDMMLRYRGLLQNVKALSESFQAEANYWIGFGLMKTNASKEAIPFLEKARSLRPTAYSKHSGVWLTLGYFTAQEPQKLAAEINLAITGKYSADIPSQVIQWSGMQSYNAADYLSAAKCLALVANPQEPRETPKEVWRYLAKARLEIGDGANALKAVDHVLALEDNLGWKADGLVDRGRSLAMLKKFPEARKSADEAIALRPQGHTSAMLNLLDGDLELQAGDAKTAAGKYLIVVEFNASDKELRPLALFKLIKALEQQADAAGAEKYRLQLKTEFPAWKSPAP